MNAEIWVDHKAGASKQGSMQDRFTSPNSALRVRAYCLIALSDIVAIVGSFFAINALHMPVGGFQHATTMSAVIVPIFLWDAVINNAYGARILLRPREGAFKAIRALIFALVALLILAYSFKVGAAFSRVIFWTGALTSAVMLVAERLIIGRMLKRRFGGVPFNTVVLCDGITWTGLPSDICVDMAALKFDPTTDNPHSYHDLAMQLAGADRVLVVCSDDRAVAWSRVLKSLAVDGEILGPDFDRLGAIGINYHAGRQTIVVSTGPLHLRERLQKRIFDLVVAGLGLIVLALPFALVAIAIRWETPGPVFFRQQRIGRDNRLFWMYKFRSMHSDQSDRDASRLTERRDARVTKVGEFIRRNSIDELPQLFNVLRGEMSVVGPRPHALSAKAAEKLYWEIDERYRHRHVVKPGVTGLAQIRGFRGATVEQADLTNRLASDLEYLVDWSIGRDMWILFRTVFVIRHANAF
jgi:lipopolysaccharide/colanic/teichoic acid biosynthesis glycosyltransferase